LVRGRGLKSPPFPPPSLAWALLRLRSCCRCVSACLLTVSFVVSPRVAAPPPSVCLSLFCIVSLYSSRPPNLGKYPQTPLRSLPPVLPYFGNEKATPPLLPSCLEIQRRLITKTQKKLPPSCHAPPPPHHNHYHPRLTQCNRRRGMMLRRGIGWTDTDRSKMPPRPPESMMMAWLMCLLDARGDQLRQGHVLGPDRDLFV